MKNINCDFSGYATRNDLLCGDGRTIRKDAFKHSDGETVPLVWNHDHGNPEAVLGNALLENRNDGVYAYCTFNDTEQGKNARELVRHGDVRSLSICANKLKQIGKDVIHGTIRELSLVLAGANPGAYIDYVLAHGDDESDSLYANYDENALVIYHSDEGGQEMDDNYVPNNDGEEDDRSLEEVLDTLNPEQREAVEYIVGMALGEDDDDEDEDDDEDYDDGEDDDDDDDDDEGGNEMKHNIFDNETNTANDNYLTHADQAYILDLAKKSNVGSFKAAMKIYAEEKGLEHADDIAPVGGFISSGDGNVTELFPEYKDVRPGAPELITNDQGWIGTVMAKVHKSPISRIRTRHVDIRHIQELRGKGYDKGKKKALTGNFNLVTRTADPQTVYVKNAINKDDVTDITGFDYVQYLYGIDRMMLNEELATAIMLGDGRDIGDEDKIHEDKIRPIWLDDELYTIHAELNIEKAKTELQGSNTGANFGENYIMAEAMINTVLYAREQFKGSGTPDFYCTPHMLNVMLLARDLNGRRVYSSKAELASALNVGAIHTCEQFEGKTRAVTGGTKKLLGLIVNLADYSLGATKGGQVAHYTDFDLDFNQLKSLIETRVSGALTRIKSAIAIEEPMVASNGTEEQVSG